MANGALESLMETYGAVAATHFRFRSASNVNQNIDFHGANLCMLKVHAVSWRSIGDPTATNEDVAALLWRYRRLYCVYLGA